jgi:hypothetical protein
VADADRRAAVARHPAAAVILPSYLDDVVRALADDVDTPGPWHYERVLGGLVIYDADGEPIALVYAGLPVARYLVAVAPAALLANGALG